MTSILFSDFLYFKNDFEKERSLEISTNMNYNKMSRDLQPRRPILQEATLHSALESSGIIPRSITLLSIKSIGQLKRALGATSIKLGWSAEVRAKLPLQLLPMRKLVLKPQP